MRKTSPHPTPSALVTTTNVGKQVIYRSYTLGTSDHFLVEPKLYDCEPIRSVASLIHPSIYLSINQEAINCGSHNYSHLQNMAEFIVNHDATAVDEREILQDGMSRLEAQSKTTIEEIKDTAYAYQSDLEEISRVSREMDETDMKVCQIHTKAELQKLREAVYGETFSIGPIHKLPAEILSYIFRYHVSLNSSPWILVKVSKYWMQTGMTTPQLWRNLVFGRSYCITDQETYVVNGKTQNSWGNRQICRDTAETQAALRRSGAVPLMITIDRNSLIGDTTYSQVIPQIFSAPLCERIQYLHISEDLGPYLTKALPFGSFPQLETIEACIWPYPWVKLLLEAISSTGNSLRRVKLGGSKTWDLSEYSFWPHIKHLSLTGLLCGDYGNYGLNSISTQLGGLERIEFIPRNWPNKFTTISKWANILHIRLSCRVEHLGRLQLPQLETLEFTDMSEPWEPHSGDFPLSFPRLVYLEVDTNSPAWPQYSANAFPVVDIFQLRGKLDNETFIATLESIPTVQHVTLVAYSRPAFGMDLLQEMQSHNGAVLCPELKWLVLGSEYFKLSTLEGSAKSLAKFIKSRIKLGKPISEMTIHWEDRKEVLNL